MACDDRFVFKIRERNGGPIDAARRELASFQEEWLSDRYPRTQISGACLSVNKHRVVVGFVSTIPLGRALSRLAEAQSRLGERNKRRPAIRFSSVGLSES